MHTQEKVYTLLLQNIAYMLLHYLEIVYSSKVLELLQFFVIDYNNIISSTEIVII